MPEHGGGAGPRAADGTGGGADEPVGSLAEEAVKLFSAVVSRADAAREETSEDPTSDDAPRQDSRGKDSRGRGPGESCPHGWCPACHTAEFVRDHPEVVAQVMTAGHELLRALRSVVDVAAADRRGDR